MEGQFLLHPFSYPPDQPNFNHITNISFKNNLTSDVSIVLPNEATNYLKENLLFHVGSFTTGNSRLLHRNYSDKHFFKRGVIYEFMLIFDFYKRQYSYLVINKNTNDNFFLSRDEWIPTLRDLAFYMVENSPFEECLH